LDPAARGPEQKRDASAPRPLQIAFDQCLKPIARV
jgi:hypothetical protein